MFYAHSHPQLSESAWQTLEEHQQGLSELARAPAIFGAPEPAALLDLIHAVGQFQAHLRGKGGKVERTFLVGLADASLN